MPQPAADLGGTGCVLGLRIMLSHATSCGVDVRAMMNELGVDPEILDDSDNRLSLRTLRRLWEMASARSLDHAFGLHVAERAGMGAFEALDYVMWASATLADVVDRLLRFHRVLGDDLGLHVMRSGPLVRLRRVIPHDQRHRAESGFAIVTLRARELCGRSFRLHEVRFVHAAPADVRPHRALFRCPVKFGCAAPELVFDAKHLQLPVRTSKPGLARVLDRHLHDLLARLPRSPTLLQRVEHAIAQTLHAGRPSLESTARALQASPRTLQRHLQELGVTHRQIVDNVRREMAERMLATRRISISEVAFLLGFEDVSGFRRTYRKWTGKSPSRGRPT
jgi:AraC-like DNA-binding protein